MPKQTDNIPVEAPTWDLSFKKLEKSPDQVLKIAFNILAILAFIYPENITNDLVKRVYNKFYITNFTDSQLKPSLNRLLKLNIITPTVKNFSIARDSQLYIRTNIAAGQSSGKSNCKWKKCLENLKHFWWSFNPNEWSSFLDMYNLLKIWQNSGSIPGLNQCRRQNIIPLFNKLAEVKWADKKFMESAYTCKLTLTGADDYLQLLMQRPLEELEAVGTFNSLKNSDGNQPLVGADIRKILIPLDTLLLVRGEHAIPPALNNAQNCYTPRESRPRGFALILNVINVANMERRYGATKDAYHLLTVFEELAYKVSLAQDIMTEEGFKKEIDAFKNTLPMLKKDIGSIIIVCCSHGTSVFGFPSLLFTGHKEHIRCDEIYKPFGGKKFKKIPKIFVFQACRGSEARQILFKPDGDEDPVAEPEVTNVAPEIPSHTILCYSTWYGHKAYRDETFGSWYIYSLVKVIKEHASRLDLLAILVKVGEEVQAISQEYAVSENKNERCFQIPEFNAAKFPKKFYFNTTPVKAKT